MFQIFPEKSIHRQQHTVLGWSVWVTIVAVGWIIAYIIGESIPFFNDLLSLSGWRLAYPAIYSIMLKFASPP